MGIDLERRIRNVTAVLGPTNTGKTHLAIERMLGHESGMIGLPLRLLAREVYDRIVVKVGVGRVALITGEEKIKPEHAKYWVCTVEAMPRDVDVDFLAIDEIQLAADPERGHVFTDRLLHARGRSETLVLGAATMRDAIADLIPGANFISRPRLSKLTYAGEKKITRLPKRTAIVAFSANEVYSIAELIRRQRGGTAVVLGALSPRTRNAQVALYQSGDVDFLVATDAIGMGLNLDVDHVAFSATRKFDGENYRELTPAELAQIGGRAGRHLNDGTFGVTGNVESLPADMVERLETHTFDPVKQLQWRNRDLDFSSLDRLRDSLREAPREVRLARARMADDVAALETVSNDRAVTEKTLSRGGLQALWEVCQIPDYRKISGSNHAELVATVYKYLMGPSERIPEDWLAQQVVFSDRTDGDIDTLSNRLAHIRTWTFVANRPDWLAKPEHWQERTRAIEDSLSDALHERLTQRFVDRRTSALVKGMRDKDELSAEIAEDGGIKVESHFVGRLKGFRFEPDTQSQTDDVHGKAARSAAAQVVGKELEMRTRRVSSAKNDAFKLTRRGRILWRNEEIARLEPGESPLKPVAVLLVDEYLTPADKERVQGRIDTWLGESIADKLKPLVEMAKADDITGLGRGIAFRMTENFGALKRDTVSDDVRTLDQNARAQLRKYGVRFGAFNIFLPPLLKPAAADLTLVLWALKNAHSYGLSLETLPEPSRPGLTSIVADKDIAEPYYRASGYHVCGPRAVRIDILERLADLIRPLIAWRPGPNGNAPPKGSSGDGGFIAVPEMMSILGCSGTELGEVLRTLGFRVERRKVKPLPPPSPVVTGTPVPAATDIPVDSAPAAAADSEELSDSAVEATVDAPAAVENATEPQSMPVVAAIGAGTATPLEEPSAPAEPTPAPVPEPIDVVGSNHETPAMAAVAHVADAVASTDASVPVDGAVEPAAVVADLIDEKFEDVWRPRRNRHEQHQRGHHSRKPQARDERRDRGPTRGATDKTATDVKDAATVPADAARSVAAADAPATQDRTDRQHDGGDRHGKDDRNRGNRERRDGNDSRDSRDRGDKRDGREPRDNRPRDARDGRRGRDERRPQAITAGPPRKGADPDSPFASLGALKQRLEQEAKERKSS